jgi:putative transposase
VRSDFGVPSRAIAALADLMVMKCVPAGLCSDNGPEFVAKDLQKWLAFTGAKTPRIERGSPCVNGYCESFDNKFWDEFLSPKIFYSMKELRVPAERRRIRCSAFRPHPSLGQRPPAPRAWLTSNKWCGEVETAPSFRLLRAANGDYLNSEINALH